MSLPAGCPGGCGPERKLELVAGAELDELIHLEHASADRCRALAQVLTRFLAVTSAGIGQELRREAQGALRAREQGPRTLAVALATTPEPVVAWWCPGCGGLDAPAPCIGVCARRPAQWATLHALNRLRASAADRLEEERRLAGAVRAIAFTHPRTGQESRHRQALREQAARVLPSPAVPTAAGSAVGATPG